MTGRPLRAGAGRGELSYEALDKADKEAATRAMIDQLKKHFELVLWGVSRPVPEKSRDKR